MFILILPALDIADYNYGSNHQRYRLVCHDMSDTWQSEGERVPYKAKATTADDFFSSSLAKA